MMGVEILSNDVKGFIDFDKEGEIAYDNLYLEDEKVVVKIPIIEKEVIFKNVNEGIKIERFNLSKYTFLMNY